MGGPFRAIVGGAAQNMSFAPAQAVELNNYSTQYGHLRNSDIFVAPGQIGQVVLVDGISAEIFVFEAPPGASQAAPTPGQICLIKTYDVAEAGVAGAPPLGPAPGLLLPIGLDSPLHLHHVTGTHVHGHGHTHSHTHGVHLHSIPNHNHSLGGPAAWIRSGPGDGDGSFGVAFLDHSHPFNGGSSGSDITGNAVGLNTNNATPTADATGASTANTAAATPGDTDLENIQHTHP